MKRLLKEIKAVPLYGWIAGVGFFAAQWGLYRLAHLICVSLGTFDDAVLLKIPAIDDAFPVVPIFVVIYLYSFVFWVLGPVIASRGSKKNFINYVITITAAYLVGFIVLVCLPTYMDRAAEGLMDYADKSGLLNQVLYSVYASDGGQIAFNLFPSFHCLISTLCYLGVMRQKEIHIGIRIYSLVMAVLICLSTLYTKQHYIPDVMSGVGIPVVCYIIIQKINPGERLIRKKEARKAAQEAG